MNLWQEPEALDEAYVGFKRVHLELAALFSRESGTPFSRTPCREGKRPVMRLARFGMQTGLAT